MPARPPLSFTPALVALLFLAGPATAEDHPDVRAGTDLLKSGDGLADDGKPNDAQIRYLAEPWLVHFEKKFDNLQQLLH